MSVWDGLLRATGSSLVSAEHVTSVSKLPDTPSASTSRSQHIPELHGFPGLAVLVVVIGHYFKYRLATLSRRFATVDKLGVLLFFALSGFLITGLRHRERSLTNTVKFRRFYIR
jgi:peptidoglycan/LPS O-acetylase OafA/YrhL